METAKLKKFAQYARRTLREVVGNKLQYVLLPDSFARRENPKAVRDLEEQIKLTSKDQVIEKVSYIWFNRFCALRFMDVNRYTRIGIVSPAEGQFQPEILAEAKMGHIDEAMVPDETKQKIFALLNGKITSNDPQSEAYRLLVVTACNDNHKTMPYLFERIADYTELLMPDDLLSGNSILAYTREALTPDVCQDVEVIGWLYQFYISEKKDEVFEGLRKNKKITPENIPAATQLFTPHWIVRYLVENSLGRLWMLNRPNSNLIKEMDYYIKPEQVETDFLKINSPEEIKICDPACGSGHMLTYAFDLLYKIYEEAGYEPNDIPEKILTNNLFGIEIDERAGELAAFALTMKARAKQRRFFSKQVQPNICVLENVHFETGELKDYIEFIGRDLFTLNLQTTLRQFEEADNFGSLIKPTVTDVAGMIKLIESKNASGNLFVTQTHQKVLKALKQADYLSPKYHVVIANPPYMGSKGMNQKLSAYVKDNYPDSKSDLFAVFIERNLDLAKKHGQIAMITMESWMFLLSSYKELREKLLNNNTLLSMAHLGTKAFDSIGGEVVSTTAFIIDKAYHPDYKGSFIDLTKSKSEKEKYTALIKSIKNPDCGLFYKVASIDFKKVPSRPIAYWVSENELNCFKGKYIADELNIKSGLLTGKDELFLRSWFEVSKNDISFNLSSEIEIIEKNPKWLPVTGGGNFRKWYGNLNTIVNSLNNFSAIKNLEGNNFRLRDPNLYFKKAINWPMISKNNYGAKLSPQNVILGNGVRTGFIFNEAVTSVEFVISYLSSIVSTNFLKVINPTLNFNNENIAVIPFNYLYDEIVHKNGSRNILLSKMDWDFFETSWDFSHLQILDSKFKNESINVSYNQLRNYWKKLIIEMQSLEEENNKIFIKAYALENELDEKVDIRNITLTCNPYYRYDNNKSEKELESLLLADTMKELISYAVGCMFGRYSLDKPGLILANQGETIEDYLKQIPEPTFMPDEDNVIPILDGDWFFDDISERFKSFLKVSFGKNYYEENLKFIENAIGMDIRKYFVKDFYNDHVKRYNTRPIYWLFSSPKESFNVLIYMHRYNRDTVNIILNDYLREFRTKLSSQIDHFKRIEASADASSAEKTKALKEIEKLNKIITEIDDYERETLYPLATERKEIDLDKGVKANYLEFGKALKEISGLKDKKE